jgi:hypothetical protein
MSSQSAPTDHIATARLRVLAVSDNGVFTETEFTHIQKCSACFSLWTQLIEDSDSENQKPD